MAPRSPVGGSHTADPARTRKSLFEDSESVSSDGEDEPTLKINEEYAKRFEHNKKREELHRLEEKYKNSKNSSGRAVEGEDDGDDNGSDSSSDETEDEDAFLITEDLDAEISATLQAIKNKDPRIYDKDAVFYQSLDPDAEAVSKAKKEKPVFIRDYQRERYLRGETGDDGGEQGGERAPRTYIQQQDELQKSILSEINAAVQGQESDDEGDTFVKPKDGEVVLQNGIHPSRAATVKITELDVAKADENPDEYLAKFMASRAWATEEGPNWAAFDSDEGEGNDDLAEEFENAYNMRFEDPEKSNAVLKSYSRVVAASRSVRHEDLAGRKKRRLLEKEKKEEEKQERREERAHLRRLKVEEAAEKLEKIKQAAGMSGKVLKGEEEWIKLLDEAWDNDKWEEDMRRKFDDEYYAQGDEFAPQGNEEDEEEGDEKPNASNRSKQKAPKKPKWDDDVDITDIVPDFAVEERPDIALTDSENDEEAEASSQRKRKKPDAEDSDENLDEPPKKRKSGKEHRQERADAKRQARQELARIETLVDAKMTLEAPTVLTGSSSNTNAASGPTPAAGPTFRYRETSPNTFGMTARDILLAPSDAALNQFAGLKKLAAFRDAEKKRLDKKRLGKKARLRQWRRDTFGEAFERTGPTFGFGEGGGGDGGDDGEGRGRTVGGGGGSGQEGGVGTTTTEDDVAVSKKTLKNRRKKEQKKRSKQKNLATTGSS